MVRFEVEFDTDENFKILQDPMIRIVGTSNWPAQQLFAKLFFL